MLFVRACVPSVPVDPPAPLDVPLVGAHAVSVGGAAVSGDIAVSGTAVSCDGVTNDASDISDVGVSAVSVGGAYT